MALTASASGIVVVTMLSSVIPNFSLSLKPQFASHFQTLFQQHLFLYKTLYSVAMAGISRLRTVAPPLARCILGLSSTRAYGCAAAQLQSDYDYYEDEIRDRMVETEESLSGRGVQWVVIGEPGSKKHVYAERLSKLLDVPHISMGSLVRQELNPCSFLYKQIANSVNQGKLVPEDIIFGLLSRRLEEGYCRGETGFILDGIPRTRMQAEILDQIADIDLVLNFKCTENNLAEKHPGTGTSSYCCDLHSMSNLGSNLNLQLQENRLKSATSDSGCVSNEKLRIYAEQSKPLEDYYRKQKKLLDFQVAGPPGETWRGLLAALHLQHVDAINSSQKLTA